MEVPQKTRISYSEKGKVKEGWARFREEEKGSYCFEILESQDSRKARYSYPLKSVISEIDQSDYTTLLIITTTKEVTIKFDNFPDVTAFHDFICKKSDVHAENRAIAKLDDAMRAIWPFPGGSFF